MRRRWKRRILLNSDGPSDRTEGLIRGKRVSEMKRERDKEEGEAVG